MPTYRPLVVVKNSNLVRYFNGTTLVPFEPQLTSPETNWGSRSIWADSLGRVITACRKASDNSHHFYHFEPQTPSAWIDKGVGADLYYIAGSSYSAVWGVASGSIWYFDGTNWTQDTAAAGGHQIAIAGSGAKEQFAAADNNIWIRDGGAIGSGNWVDYRAQLNTDTGLDVSGSLPDCVGVWAAAADAVYWLISGSRNTQQHYVVRWNGTSFSIVSSTSVNNYNVSRSSFHGSGPANLWWAQADPSWGAYHYCKFNGSDIIRQAPGAPDYDGPEHNMTNECGLVIPLDGQTADHAGYSAGARRQTGSDYDVVLWALGATWSEIVRITQGAALTGSAGLAMWPSSTSPYLQNQNPAPSATGIRGDATLYLEVADADGDLDASTVQIWINGTLAWSGSSAASGHSGTRGTVSGGYSYTFSPDTPLPAGATVTIRVYAQDGDGNVLDESYSFQTSVFLDSVTPDPITERGGTILTITGLFVIDEILTVTLGGQPCYGLQGKGYSPSSDDGRTVQVASPPLTTGGVAFLSVTGSSGAGSLSLIVAERSWPKDEFELNRLFPPWEAVGARRLALEDQITFAVEEEEAIDMPSPKVTYTNVTTVAVDLPDGAMGQAVSYKLQDGETYSFAGSASCDLSASGVNGLDTGSEANNTWYHLYLVVDGGVLKPIFSAADPGTGPSGHTNFLPIMAVYNNGSGDIRPFHPVASDWCQFTEEDIGTSPNNDLLLYGSDSATQNAWVDVSTELSVAVPVAVADEVEVLGWADSDSGGFWILYLAPDASPAWTPDSSPNSDRAGAFDAWSNEDTKVGRRRIPIPNGELAWYVDETAGSTTWQYWMKIQGFRHRYRW